MPIVDDQERFTAVLARLEAGEAVEADELDEVVALGGDRFAGGAIGLVWDRLALDRVTAHLDADERHHQPFGIVHGGVWCSVVESLASIAGALQVAASGRIVVGVHNATDFIRPHRTGRVDATATPVHRGRTQQLWLVEIVRAGDGKAVARGQVRLQNLDPAEAGGR